MTPLLALTALTAATVALSACGPDPWIVASERVPRAEDDSRPAPMGTFAGGPPDCVDTAGLVAERRLWGDPSDVPDPAHVGAWSGELSGSAAADFPGTNVLLEVRADGTGSLWIEGAPPPAPERADGSYLCDGSVSGGVCGSVSGYVGGFPYPLEAALSRASILSFSIVDADPWEPWCSLQTPMARDEPFVDCGVAFDAVPPRSERWATQGCQLALATGDEAIDCGRMYSLGRCQCARNGCIASFATWIDVGLRLSSDGTELSGSLWFKNGTDAATLRLGRL